MAGDPTEVSHGALIPDFPLPPGVRAAVTTRTMRGVSPSPFDACNLGSRCGDAPVNVAANRAAAREALSLPSEPRWLRQVHGVGLHVLTSPGDPAIDALDEPIADAAYANRAGLVCVVQTADCLPLLLASDDGREVAAVHAGWRGLAAGTIESALRQFAAPLAEIRVWLGPAIGPHSYEVGDEVRAAFLAHDARAAEAFSPTRPGHWHCDLYALARQRLAAAGVTQVHGGGFDTLTDARFYSHRRSRPTGRFASLIWIESRRSKWHNDTAVARGLAREAHASPLVFPRLLGRSLQRLPLTVQALHLRGRTQSYSGRVNITRGKSWLARLCAFVTGMPPAMNDAPLTVEIRVTPGKERWTRDFDGHRLTSTMRRRNGRLSERLGPVAFRFQLGTEGGVLTWTVKGVRVLGIPLPARWFRGVHAQEFEQDGRYCFDVTAALPLAGELVHYRGWLDVSTDWARQEQAPGEELPDWEFDSDGGSGDSGSGDGGSGGGDD